MTFKGFLHYVLRVSFIKTKEFFAAGLALTRMASALTTKMPSKDDLKMSLKNDRFYNSLSIIIII